MKTTLRNIGTILAVVFVFLVLGGAGNTNYATWLNKYKGEAGLHYNDQTDAGNITHEDGTTVEVYDIQIRNSIIIEQAAEADIEPPTGTGQFRIYAPTSYLQIKTTEGTFQANVIASTTDEAVFQTWISSATEPLPIYKHLNDEGDWQRDRLYVFS